MDSFKSKIPLRSNNFIELSMMVCVIASTISGTLMNRRSKDAFLGAN